jgi:hypothetical protein
MLLAADTPEGVPSSDRTYAVLLGIAAVVTAFASPLVAYLVGRRKANEDEVPKLRRELRRQARDIEDLQADVLNMSRYAFTLQQVALSKGVTMEDLPPAPVLRITRPRRDAEETG